MDHTKDVLSAPFSADKRQIVFVAHDHTIKLWNTLGVCKYTIQVGCYIILPSEIKFRLCTSTAFACTCGGAKVINCVDVLGGRGGV